MGTYRIIYRGSVYMVTAANEAEAYRKVRELIGDPEDRK